MGVARPTKGAWLTSLCIITAVATSATGDNGAIPDHIDKSAARTLSMVPGDPDPAQPHRIAERLGSRQLVTAFYRGTREERLAALDAAAATQPPEAFSILPSLAALMGAKDRQVASRATRALLRILRRGAGTSEGFRETVPAQIDQLREQLRPLSLDRRLNTDVRGVALQAVTILDGMLPPKEQTWLRDLFDDDDRTIKRSAITALRPPLDDGILKKLAVLATTDADLGTRGYASAMICENALAHGVEEPSNDLVGLLRATLENTKIPVDTLGGLLACIGHFKGDSRADLIDLAIAHPHPAVGDFWKSQKDR